MAWQLTREVLDHSPAGLGPGERAVLLAIAEFAPATSRRFTGRSEHIARRAHLSADGMRKALQRLARHGLEPRVALTTGRDGRAVYTVPGRSPTFRLPVLAPAGCDCWSCRGDPSPSTEGGTTVPPFEEEGGTTVPPSQPIRRDERASKAGREDQAGGNPRPALSVPKYSEGTRAHAGTRAREADVEPAGRCVSHVADPKPPPCGACADARRVRDEWLAARAALRDACLWCNEQGWLERPDDGRPIVQCDHRTDPARQVADARARRAAS